MECGIELEDFSMKQFALVVTAAVAVCTFATPTLAGSNNNNNQQGYYYRWEPQNHGHGALHAQNGSQAERQAQRYGMSAEEYRALQIRKECQMYAFGYWRYHPDHLHCGYN
jgi:hypothetical protein